MAASAEFVRNIKQSLGKHRLRKFPLAYVLENGLIQDGLLVELGTGKGITTNDMARFMERPVHTFDSFQGRTENWREGYQQGSNSRSPLSEQDLNPNIVLHVGTFANNLPAFVKKYRVKGKIISLLHIDCETYQSAKEGLTILNPLLKRGSIIVFNEFLNYPGCEKHEMRAFEEFLLENGKRYETIGMYGTTRPRKPDDWRQQKAGFRVYKKKDTNSIAGPGSAIILSSESGAVSEKQYIKEREKKVKEDEKSQKKLVKQQQLKREKSEKELKKSQKEEELENERKAKEEYKKQKKIEKQNQLEQESRDKEQKKLEEQEKKRQRAEEKTNRKNQKEAERNRRKALRAEKKQLLIDAKRLKRAIKRANGEEVSDTDSVDLSADISIDLSDLDSSPPSSTNSSPSSSPRSSLSSRSISFSDEEGQKSPRGATASIMNRMASMKSLINRHHSIDELKIDIGEQLEGTRIIRSKSNGDIPTFTVPDGTNFKVKVVVTYGKKEYFECLLPYLVINAKLFDRIIIWANTKSGDDMKYLHEAMENVENDKFEVMYPERRTGDRRGVFPLYAKLQDDKTFYIKIDHDVVYIEDGAFERLIKFAMINRNKYSIFSANMINSGPLDAVHQSKGASARDPVVFDIKKPFDKLKKIEGAKQVHDSILRAIEEEDIQRYYTEHNYLKGEKWSISAIGFFSGIFNGKDLKEIAKGDEEYITKKLGKMKDRYPVVVPNAVMIHYSFSEQRKRPGSKRNFDPEGLYLTQYRELAQQTLQASIEE